MPIKQRINLKTFSKSVGLFLLLGLFLWWGIPILTNPNFKHLIESMGPLGPLVIVGYIALSHIVAPLAGTPAVLVAFAIYGLERGLFYLYVGSLVSAVICFAISRIWGRALMKRLVDPKTIYQIDIFAKQSGRRYLLLARIFGAPIFEVISYASGLATMSFKDYFLITTLSSIIPNVLNYWIFRTADFDSPQAHIVWLGMIIGTGIVFSFIALRILQSKEALVHKRSAI